MGLIDMRLRFIAFYGLALLVFVVPLYAQEDRNPGQVVKNGLGMEFISLPSGEFLMGSNAADTELACALTKNVKDCKERWLANEKPKHRVKIDAGILIMRFEVTQSQWRWVMGTTWQQQRDKQGKRRVFFGLFEKNRSLLGVGDDLPMYYVSWEDANAFVHRMNQRNDGFIYSLPSESEWEYACRAATTSLFSFGNKLYLSNGNAIAENDMYLEKVVKVVTYSPNAWGLFDMEGNVAEWTADMYFESYDTLPVDGSPNLSKRAKHYGENVRVLRGGGWNSSQFNARCARRGYDSEKFGWHDVGFRLTARKK
ncbi:MAG TPA: formylglycine-generating enzyme family protein [Pyrinomonadaceae bacterium]|nr:formylglycine-generating enzyme family protein [Pyrinomonadaceae bacterium]